MSSLERDSDRDGTAPLELAPDPAREAEEFDAREYVLRLDSDAAPLDLLKDCRFDAVRDEGLLRDCFGSPPGVIPIRSRTKILRARLFFIPRNMSTEALVSTIASRGARSADRLECLAFAATYPEVQRRAVLATLGWSTVSGPWTRYAALTVETRGRVFRAVSPPSWPSKWRYLIICP
jgi:hypothetical protein